MEQVLEAKFDDRELADRLIATYPHKLVEGNAWHDQFLGVALMELRDRLFR
jgi:predicted NAD-dependent protein-ADP-ribosyltransferase YbiA (DUF1768 family)